MRWMSRHSRRRARRWSAADAKPKVSAASAVTTAVWYGRVGRVGYDPFIRDGTGGQVMLSAPARGR